MNEKDPVSSENAAPATDTPDVLVRVDDYTFPRGWSEGADAAARGRYYCEQLEDGRVLCFDTVPFVLFEDDEEFLLSQHQSGSSLHKNVSYRPVQDILRGAAGGADETARMHNVMRKFSEDVTRFIKQFLSPYATELALDYASFRPEEEQGRDLSLHKRNDLLHFDSFPTRPMNGHRILRCFTNIHPTASRIWQTTDGFKTLAEKFAMEAGLMEIAAQGSAPSLSLVRKIKKAFGFKAVDHSAYDRFMLRFHDFLKENTDFQQNCPKVQLEFKPSMTWMCFTDAVPHAVLSGRYALEQTYIIPLTALLEPEKAPVHVLESMAGTSLRR